MSEWIDVNDRLPNYLQEVLVFDGDVCVAHLEYTPEKGNYWTDGWDELKVTHWMPKPWDPV